MRKIIYLLALFVCLLYSKTMNLDEIKKAALENNFARLHYQLPATRTMINSSPGVIVPRKTIPDLSSSSVKLEGFWINPLIATMTSFALGEKIK